LSLTNLVMFRDKSVVIMNLLWYNSLWEVGE
jgi:hypothetical protein